MTSSPFRRLVVQPVDWTRGDGHVTLAVRPEVADVNDENGAPTAVGGFDPTDPAAWVDLGCDAIDVAGTLARIAFDVLPDVLFNAREHGCNHYLRAESDADKGAEVRRAWLDANTCTVRLYHDDLAHRLLDDGVLPTLFVTIPSNRVRAWTARLHDAIAAVSEGAATTLAPLHQPADQEEA